MSAPVDPGVAAAAAAAAALEQGLAGQPQTLAGSAVAFYTLLAALSEQAGQVAVGLWDELDPAALGASWIGHNLTDRMLLTVGTAQQAATVYAGRYVEQALELQDVRSGGELLAARVFAGLASDGRNMDDLLRSPLIRTGLAVAGGLAVGSALYLGRNAIRNIVKTQIADTGRAAIATKMAAEPTVRGYVRMLTPPSCGRCAVLAGRVYKYDAGFPRHPRCDCISIPYAENVPGDLRTDPELYFQSLDPASQDRYFTVAGAEAIREGGDIGQVVNARRGASGLSTPGRLTDDELKALRTNTTVRLDRVDVYGRPLAITHEGTTRRGLAGARLIAEAGERPGTRSRAPRSRVPRLMPEAIIQIADGDRDLAVDLLHRHGYLV